MIFPLADAGPGSWRPHPDPRHPFAWTCPQCGKENRAWHMRRVTPDGRVSQEIACDGTAPPNQGCGWSAGDVMLEGWNHAEHWKPEPPFAHPVRREMRHACGTVISLEGRDAEAHARDPRITRGHWCPVCQRHGWNHEWRWLADNKVVGEGAHGLVLRYADLTPEGRKLVETHYPIPAEIL